MFFFETFVFSLEALDGIQSRACYHKLLESYFAFDQKADEIVHFSLEKRFLKVLLNV